MCNKVIKKINVKTVYSYNYSLHFDWDTDVKELVNPHTHKSVTQHRNHEAMLRLGNHLRRLREEKLFVGRDPLTRTVWHFSKIMRKFIIITLLCCDFIDATANIEQIKVIIKIQANNKAMYFKSKNFIIGQKNYIPISKYIDDIESTNYVKIYIVEINNRHWSDFFMFHNKNQQKNIDFC